MPAHLLHSKTKPMRESRLLEKAALGATAGAASHSAAAAPPPAAAEAELAEASLPAMGKLPAPGGSASLEA